MDLLKLQFDYIYFKFETTNSKGTSKQVTNYTETKYLVVTDSFQTFQFIKVEI